MSKDILERVARAICAADFHDWPDDGYNGRTQRDAYTKMARAALEAMAPRPDDLPGGWSREATLVLK